jgi:hypothetical protein
MKNLHLIPTETTSVFRTRNVEYYSVYKVKTALQWAACCLLYIVCDYILWDMLYSSVL